MTKKGLLIFAILALILLTPFSYAGCSKQVVTTTVPSAPTAVPTITTTVAKEVIKEVPVPATTQAQLPKAMALISTGIGSGRQAISVAMAPTIEKYSGMSVRNLPSGSALARFQMLAAEPGRMELDDIPTALVAQQATDEFSDKDIGPMKVRAVMRLSIAPQGPAVKANSDIQTVAQFKGKRVGTTPTEPAINAILGAVLAFANLTWNDVTPVQTGGWVDMHQAMLDGRIDVLAFSSPRIAAVREIEASPSGIRFLNVPSSDKEGWARINKIVPALTPIKNPPGYGIKQAENLEMLDMPNMILTTENADDNFVYTVIKILAEKTSEFGSAYPLLENAAECGKALDLYMPVIWHTGTIKYFKEKGLWKPEHDAWQKQMLNWESAIEAAWFTAIIDAKAKGITVDAKNDKWQQFWATYRPAFPVHK